MNILPIHSILYEDKNVLILNKIAAVPSVSDLSGDPSMQDLAENYFSQKLFPVNRLDRPSTGIQMFARNADAAAFYGDLLKKQKIKKIYLAITEDKPKEESGILQGWISVDKKKNKAYFNMEDPGNGKVALSNYQLLAGSDNYHLVAIELISGRQHQIRAQLSFLKCPIKGDVKYGARRKNQDRSIGLHALWADLPLMGSEQSIRIFAPLPQDKLWQYFNPIATAFFNKKK
jgi:23S rRNA pseudouridine1911/1915/1917 synthase